MEVTTQAGAGLKVLGTRKRRQPPGPGKGGKQTLPDSCCKESKHLMQPTREPFLDFQLP